MEEILVIDDEPMIRSMMETALSTMGYAVTAAGSVGEALELYENETERFDALVTDFNLEDGTGLDIVNTVRGNSKDTPVILMTGSWKISQSFSNQAGFSAYFHKPFSCVEMGRELDSLLHKAC